MAYKNVKEKLKRSMKKPADYLEEEELSNPYENMDFNKMSKAMESGVDPEELDEIAKKKREMRQRMERLRLKQ
jgi:hypothetical protein